MITLLFTTPESSTRVSVDGDMEVTLLLEEEDAGGVARPFHRWTFPRERLADHQRHTVFGWAYIFKLDWGSHVPRPGPALLAVQFRPASTPVPAPAEVRQRVMIPATPPQDR